MSYMSTSCFLNSDPIAKRLEVKNAERKVLFLEDAAYLALSNPIYPIVLPVAIAAQSYFATKLAYAKVKIVMKEDKFSRIDEMTVDALESAVKKRLMKLNDRLKKSESKLSTMKEKYSNLGDAIEMEEFSTSVAHKFAQEKYRKVEGKIKQAEGNGVDPFGDDSDGEELASEWKESQKEMDLFGLEYRTREELKAYPENDFETIKQIFKDRVEFAKIKNQISATVSLHYIKNIVKIEIPVLGMLYYSHSKKTVDSDDLLELIGKHNDMMKKHQWLELYK